MTYEEMIAQRAKLNAEADEIIAASGDNGKEMSEEQLTRITEINAENDKLDADIKAEDAKVAQIEMVAARSARMNEATTRQSPAKVAEQVVSGIHDRAEDDPMHGFVCAGDFYMSAFQMFANSVPDNRLFLGAAASGMSQGSGAEGGILVPPTFSKKIWDAMNVGAENLLGATDGYPIEGDSWTCPANAETSRATGSRYGGVRGYWLAEAEQMTSSKPKLRQMKLEPHEMAVLVYVTDKLLRNAAAAEKYVTGASTDEIQFLTGDAIINGNGAGKPKGILASGSLITQTKEVGQAAATVVAENVVNMWSRLHTRARSGSVWYINQEIEPQLTTMSIAVGTGGQLIYMPPGGLSGAQYGTLYGRPVVPIEYCEALGTEGDIILANLGYYATGVKSSGIRSDASIHLRFDYAETAFRFMFEVDGQPWLASALTPYKGSNTLSTHVSLETRS